MRARWGLGGAGVLAFADRGAGAGRPRRTPCARWPQRPAPATATSRAVTIVGDGDALVVRYLGRERRARRARFCTTPGGCVRPALLGRAAVPPRVWAT